MAQASGRHFLQIPGPSPVPTVSCGNDTLVIDHRALSSANWGRVLEKLKAAFGDLHVIRVPVSGTGREAALLIAYRQRQGADAVTGQFATLWCELARALARTGTDSGDWRSGVDPTVAERLRADTAHEIKAAAVHNETSTGGRRAQLHESTRPPPSTVSGRYHLRLPVDYQHDAQQDYSHRFAERLMPPPGLGFNRALQGIGGAREERLQ